MVGREKTSSTSWCHHHVKNTAPITISAATTLTLERYLTMMKAHSLKRVSSTFPLGLEVDRTLQSHTPEVHLGLTIMVYCHDFLVPFLHSHLHNYHYFFYRSHNHNHHSLIIHHHTNLFCITIIITVYCKLHKPHRRSLSDVTVTCYLQNIKL